MGTQVKVLVFAVSSPPGRAHEAFDEEGSLKDPKQPAVVASLCAKLVETTARLHP